VRGKAYPPPCVDDREDAGKGKHAAGDEVRAAVRPAATTAALDPAAAAAEGCGNSRRLGYDNEQHAIFFVVWPRRQNVRF